MVIISYNFSSSLCPSITITIIHDVIVNVQVVHDGDLHYFDILVIIVVASGLYSTLSCYISVSSHQLSAITTVSLAVIIVAVVIVIPLFIIITSAAQ